MKPGLRKRFFAWMLKNGDAYSHKLYGSFKRELFKNIDGRIVEIGPGTGVNFQYLPTSIDWVGIEPNEAFFDSLKGQARERRISAHILKGDASQIPVDDNSTDAVLSTLVLCSVGDPAKVLAEIKRVLKPGGKLIFLEHVAAPKHTSLRMAQNIFNPLNRIAADGCNCNRETWSYLKQAGFSELEISPVRMKGVLRLHSPHIMGYAIK
jgi:ubiquinone/menaquinone biosynthesis C-methylase UbiE